MDYAELQAEIADWMDRTDLTDKIPGFITLCEKKINRYLRTGDQSILSSILGDGTGTYAITDDVRGLRSVSVGGKPLAYLPPDIMLGAIEANYTTVAFYTIEGLEIRLNSTINDPTTLDLLGYLQVPALSDLVTTNWVLDRHEDAYLYGSLAEACKYVKDYMQEEANRELFSDAVVDISDEDQRDRWSGATMSMVAV